MEAIYFASPEELREWYANHHDKATELLVGFYKKHTGTPSVTYQEALDEALCFGWIDGIRRRVDDDRYTNRFIPRRPRSIWSQVNIKRVGELTELGRMHPAGLKAFNERDPARTQQYSNEQANLQLDPAYEAEFKANSPAWDFFQAQPPSYRTPATWWVMSAKKEETRRKRLRGSGRRQRRSNGGRDLHRRHDEDAEGHPSDPAGDRENDLGDAVVGLSL